MVGYERMVQARDVWPTWARLPSVCSCSDKARARWSHILQLIAEDSETWMPMRGVEVANHHSGCIKLRVAAVEVAQCEEAGSPVECLGAIDGWHWVAGDDAQWSVARNFDCGCDCVLGDRGDYVVLGDCEL